MEQAGRAHARARTVHAHARCARPLPARTTRAPSAHPLPTRLRAHPVPALCERARAARTPCTRAPCARTVRARWVRAPSASARDPRARAHRACARARTLRSARPLIQQKQAHRVPPLRTQHARTHVCTHVRTDTHTHTHKQTDTHTRTHTPTPTYGVHCGGGWGVAAGEVIWGCGEGVRRALVRACGCTHSEGASGGCARRVL